MTRQRIDAMFQRLSNEGRPALVVYLTVGDPHIDETPELALAALEAGADALELGVPFSDPTADGPVIAAASYRAIQHGGSLRSTLAVAKTLREQSSAPLVLFGYVNPLLAFGAEGLPVAAREAGIDGMLVVDLPPEEGAELRDAAESAELAMIPLVAPTTGLDREPLVLRRASGFIYYVSLTGVTGAGNAPLDEAGRAAAALKARAGLPVVVGFGIDTPEKARAVAASGVDGVAVGTAVVRAIASGASAKDRVFGVKRLVSSLREALG